MMKTNTLSLNRILDEMFQPFPGNWGKDDANALVSIPVNMHETNDAYHLELLAPGRTKEEFKISVEKNILNVSFERENSETRQDYKTVRREFSITNFKRSFTLTEKLDAENIKAKYDNGILTVYVPKKEEVKIEPKQINVN